MSPSGKGCHVITVGHDLPKGSKRFGLEFYSSGHYFTFSGITLNSNGHELPQGPMIDRPDVANALFAELNPPAGSKPTNSVAKGAAQGAAGPQAPAAPGAPSPAMQEIDRLEAYARQRTASAPPNGQANPVPLNGLNGNRAHIEPTGEEGASPGDERRSAGPSSFEDQADSWIVHRASIAANGAKFRDLYAGRWEGLKNHTGVPYPSQSEADEALCFMLPHYTRDREQIARIFLASGLGQREKAMRGTYLYGTIDKALAAPPLPRRGNSASNGAAGAPYQSGQAEHAERTNDEPPWVWPQIGVIFSNLRPVPPFNAEILLPPVLRAWIANEAERMPCLQEFVASGALVMLGAVIGAGCGIVPKNRDNWMIMPNLWGAMVGDPSSKKSPAWKAAKAPLRRLIKEEKKAYREALNKYETEKENFKAECEVVLKRIKTATKNEDQEDLEEAKREWADLKERTPKSPSRPRRLTNNATTPSLSELLRDNHNILLERDELVGSISDWDREGNEADRAFMLEGWNGNQGYESDRIIRGNTDVDNACISVFGGLTTDSLAACGVRANNVSNDGMLQRFQVLICPDPRQWEWRNRYPDREAINKIFDLVKKLSNFDPVAIGAFTADDFHDFPYFIFDEEAHEVFKAWTINPCLSG
jgi:Protein of unknown function (DUF3987)